MTKLEARRLCAMGYDEIWSLAEGKYLVQFDDDELEMWSREIILSYYFWWPQRLWPKTPLLTDHAVNRDEFHKTTPRTLMEKTAWLAYDYMHGAIQPEELAFYVKKEFSRIYNDLTYNLEEYVTSISALDFLNILNHPKVVEANQKAQALDLESKGGRANSQLVIAKTHEAVKSIMMSDPSFAGNRLVEVVRPGLVDIHQVLQCVTCIGHRSEIDSTIYPIPIMVGFGEGIRDLYSMLVESRSAAKASFFTQQPLQETEYANRQLQLMGATLRNLHRDDDCGSTDYVPWTISKSNLKTTAGMWYYDPDARELKEVLKTDNHLIGKTLLLRTAMTCRHSDPYGICGKCYGEIRLSVMPGTNVGHASVTELCAPVSQNVMSTKHLDSSAVVGDIVIADCDKKYIRAFPETLQLGLSERMREDVNVATLIVPKDGVMNLADIYLLDNVRKLNPAKVSAMDDVTLLVPDEDGDEEYCPVSVAVGSRKSFFTTKFLQFIKDNGFTEGENRTIYIRLEGWDPDEPIWSVPRRHASTLEYLRDITANIKITGSGRGRHTLKRGLDLSDAENLATSLADLNDMVSVKVRIHLTHLATILRTTMVRDRKAMDYHLPSGDEVGEFAPYRDLLSMRSLTAGLAYQELDKLIFNPATFVVTNRPAHPFDEIVMGDR